MKIKNKIISLPVVFFILMILYPQFTFASWNDLTAGLAGIQTWVGTLGQIMFALATVVFFWGLVKFIWSPGEKNQGKNIMIWGIVGLFVMFTIWGIISFMQTSTIGTATSVPKPAIP